MMRNWSKKVIILLLLSSMIFLFACDFMIDEEIREIAKSGSYTDCANLNISENKNRIDMCYSYVGKKQNNPAACEAASSKYSDSCFKDVAIDLHREDLCKKINSNSNKHDCFVDIAVYKKDPNICKNLKSSEVNDCYKKYSIDSDDFNSCALIPENADESDECYLHFAVTDNNAGLCADLNSKTLRDKCYYDIALASVNQNICDSIEQGSKREQCYEQVKGNSEGFEEDSIVDTECEDPTFKAKCASYNTLLTCNNGKKSISRCKHGCFEAACRSEAGETDIEPPKEEKEEDVELDDVDEADENDEVDKEDEKETDDEKTVETEDEEDDDEIVECESDSDCSKKENCFDGICLEFFDEGCEFDDDCFPGEICLSGVCAEDESECWFTEECKIGEVCTDNKCVPQPKCKKGDKSCVSPLILEFCKDDVMTTINCKYACEDNKCLTKSETEKRDEEKKKEEECKKGYTKCISETTLEVCSDGIKDTTMCEFGCDKNACKKTNKKCTGLQRFNPFCSEDDSDIEDKVEKDLNTIKDAASGKYMELLDKEIENMKDPAKLKGLKKYKEFLEKSGKVMGDVQTTVDTLKDLKRIFLDSYDPSMDIENMEVRKILSKGLFDRISDSIFSGPKTEAGKELAEAEDSLTVYQAMLERQKEIDFLKTKRMDRLGSVVAAGAKTKLTSKLSDKATDIAGKVAGKAMIAVTVVDYALSSFQAEAKQQLFNGLARAYNRRRADLEKQYPNMENADIHKLATKQVQDMPYQDNKGRSFLKFGNILENKDCQAKTGNQLCIDNRVFWTAMNGAYEHTHSSDLHKRFIGQLDRQLAKD